MKLLFKQRLLSWFDSYDIYNESGQKEFTVKGQLAWGHRLKIYDRNGCHIGEIKQVILTLLPKFDIYVHGKYIGCIRKEFTLLRPKYDISFNGWHIEGNFLEWDYNIIDPRGYVVSSISKEILHLRDTYTININDPNDALCALMVVLAIDIDKCSRGVA